MDNIIYIGIVLLVAGVVKGVTGMGLPTVAVAMLSLAMTPLEAAGLLIVPSLLTNVWQLLATPECPLYPMWLRLRPMMAGICLGTIAGSALLRHSGAAAGMLGLALMAYAMLGLFSVRWTVGAEAEHWLAPLAGAVTGVLSAATGVFVLPAVPYLQALGLRKEELVQAMGLAFTVSTLALATSLAAHDAWQPATAGASFVAQLPALAGMLLGQRLRAHLHPQAFRRCLLAALLLMGMYLALALLA
jgi:uncharacterized membrane protein YfcA